MSNLSISFFSNTLNRSVSFQMIIPNDFSKNDPIATENAKRPRKTLFLLHGYTGSAYNWIPDELARKYNFAIVIPNGENGFWCDGLCSGHAYAQFVGEELLNYVRNTFGLAKTAEETAICGLSMGGFGSLRIGLGYADDFGKILALSSAYIIHGVKNMKPGDDNGVANYYYYNEVFGGLDNIDSSNNNPEVLISKRLADGKALPKIWMACGTEDFLLENNRGFHKFLEEKGIEHTYFEDHGQHNDEFWGMCVKKFIPELFD